MTPECLDRLTKLTQETPSVASNGVFREASVSLYVPTMSSRLRSSSWLKNSSSARGGASAQRRLSSTKVMGTCCVAWWKNCRMASKVRKRAGRLMGVLRGIEELGHEGGDIFRCRAHVEAHLVERRGVDIGPKDLYPRQVRRRPAFLTATPPKHQSALILRHVRECLGTTRLADSGFTGDQNQLTSTRKHAVKRCPEYVKFARPTDDRSMLIPPLDSQIAHADLILQTILDAASHQKW